MDEAMMTFDFGWNNRLIQAEQHQLWKKKHQAEEVRRNRWSLLYFYLSRVFSESCLIVFEKAEINFSSVTISAMKSQTEARNVPRC